MNVGGDIRFKGDYWIRDSARAGFVEIGSDMGGSETELIVSRTELVKLGGLISRVLEGMEEAGVVLVSPEGSAIPVVFADFADDVDVMVEVKPCCDEGKHYPACVVFENSAGERFELVLSGEQIETLKRRLIDYPLSNKVGFTNEETVS